MIKNVIFDWSGVLSDDFSPVYKAVIGVFAELGIKEISVDEFRREFTLPVANFYKKYTDATMEKVQTLFLDQIHKVGEPKPFDGVMEAIRKLKDLGINMVVVSSHPQSKLTLEMKNYGLSDCFKEVNGGVLDKVKVIKDILRRSSFNPNETAYVGDMNHDIEAGKEADTKTVAVTWGYQSEEKLRRYKPDFIASNITELERILLL